MFLRIHTLAIFLFCAVLLTGCAQSQASAIPLLSNGTGVTLEQALPQAWLRQNIGDSSLSIGFPSRLSVTRLGSAASALYTISGTGTEIFAFMRPYAEQGDEFDRFIWRLRAEGSGGCKVITEDLSRLLDVDVLRTHRCREVATDSGRMYSVIGYSASAEVVDIASVMVFLGPDRALFFDDVFSMEQMSPEAARQITEYFARHPQVTRRWPEDRNVQALDRILRTILDSDMGKPSPTVAAAFAFMERVAQSARWVQE